MIIINDTITTNNSNDDDDADDLEVTHPHSRSSSNIPGRIGIWKSWFSRTGEKWSNRRKPLGAKEGTNNKLSPNMTCPDHIAKATYRSKFHFPKYVNSVHGCKAVMLKYIKVLRKADPL